MLIQRLLNSCLEGLRCPKPVKFVPGVFEHQGPFEKQACSLEVLTCLRIIRRSQAPVLEQGGRVTTCFGQVLLLQVYSRTKSITILANQGGCSLDTFS